MTAIRTNELLKGRWAEIDFETAVWTIPPERMKAKREHRVLLTNLMIADLNSLPRLGGNPYLFPGARYDKSLSNMAMLQLMRGIG